MENSDPEPEDPNSKDEIGIAVGTVSLHVYFVKRTMKVNVELRCEEKEKGNIKWNFGKILVGKDGIPIERFGSMTSPSSKKLVNEIEKALQG